jgi:hypothetical protein
MLMGFEAFGVLLAPEVLIGIEAAAAVFEVATSLASDLTMDKPLSDQIKAKWTTWPPRSPTLSSAA